MLITEKLLLGDVLTILTQKISKDSDPSLRVSKIQKITTLVFGSENDHYVVPYSYAFVEKEENIFLFSYFHITATNNLAISARMDWSLF
jgi:hypothetical protein